MSFRVIAAVGAAVYAFPATALADDDDRVGRLAPRGDPLVVGARYDAPSTLETPGAGQLDHYAVFAGGGVPLVNDGWSLGISGRYRFDHIELNGATQGNASYDLHTFTLSVFGRVPISRRLTLFGFLGIISASDLESVRLGSFQPAFAAYASYTFGDADALVFGAGLARVDGTLYPVPFIGYVHQAKDSPFRFDVLLPEWIRAYYAIVPQFRLTAGIDYDSESWAVTRDVLPNVQSTQIQLYGGARVIGPAHLFVEARGGAEVYQSYVLPGVANGSSTSARPTPYGQVTLGISH